VSTLELHRAWHGPLTAASARLTGGTYVALGRAQDGAAALIELSAGIVRPSSGQVFLDGKAPFADPETRRRIGALGAEERLPPAKTVALALGSLLRAREDTRSAGEILDQFGLSWLLSRRPSSLILRETRAVALALALSQREPLLLALFEPLSLDGIIQEGSLRESVARCSGAGAVVLTTASRLEDAATIEGTLSVLERGTWLGASAARAPTETVALRVRSADATRLARALAAKDEISALEAASPRELIVHGNDPERVAAHVLTSAKEAAITIEALRIDAPTLSELTAARERAARAEQATLRAYAARPIFYGPGPTE